MKKLLLLIMFFLLTGCKYTELNDLAIIKNSGIKYCNNYILYTMIIDEVNKDNIPKTKIIETNGNDINEAFVNLRNTINKEIYLSHIDLIILDKNLNKKDYQNIIDYFLNHQELRNDFLTVISSDIKNLLNNTKYDEIEELITNKDNIIKLSFEELIQKYLDNKDIILPEIVYDNELKFIDNQKIERINNV